MVKLFFYFSGIIVNDIKVHLRSVLMRALWRCKGVKISRGTIINEHHKNAIVLENGCTVGYGTLLIATNEFSLLSPEISKLHIGERTAINEYCNIRASGGTIKIGNDCLIGQMVSLIASNHSTKIGESMRNQFWDEKVHSIYIGQDVWIGSHVTILPGTRIDSGCVIAAGSVVRGHVPSNEIWGGIPAKFIKKRV
jgi:NDP-sugar pyrophosphorylase family protein